MFDVFVAPLTCPNCGSAVPDAEIQTHIRDGSADSSTLGVGFELDAQDLTAESLADAGYTPVTAPDRPTSIRLLDVWTCPQCETEQWAAIDVVDGTVREIAAVTLDGEVLESAHFISDIDADLLAEALVGTETARSAGSVEALRRSLPRAPGATSLA